MTTNNELTKLCLAYKAIANLGDLQNFVVYT